VATLTSPGVGSNLDVKNIVSQLMSVERKPLTLLDDKVSSYNTKVSAYGKLKSALFSLQTAAQNLNLTSAFNKTKANVADTASLSANVSGVAIPGSYSIEVQSLAQSQKLISGGYGMVESPIGSGTITLNFGTYDTTEGVTSFVPNPGKTATTLTIDPSNNSLAGIRDAVNNANAGVRATIINDGTGYRLSLTSVDTGLNNALKIDVTESGGAGLAQLAYDASTGGVSQMTQNVAAKNAVIKVDDVTITKPGNIITDAIEGVTLNLTKEMAAGTKTTLSLTRDTTGTRTTIDAFVKAYNDINKQITELTAYDSSSGTGSVLTGDATVRAIQTQLRNVFTNAIPGTASNLSTLSAAGIQFQKDGSLSVDSDKLDKILADPKNNIGALFATSDSGIKGYASRLNDVVKAMVFGNDGLLNTRVDGINTTIKNINAQKAAMNAHLAEVEKRYNAQFTALDTAIASMTTTSNFLTQQLANLSTNK
jgi:flagellar hook-associated protein 2